MKRIFGLIVIFAVASVGASAAFAQSRRVYRVEPPKEERAAEEKSERKGEAKAESKEEAKDKTQGEARETSGREQVLTAKEVTTRAVIKSKPHPTYSREARRYGVQGTVKLRIILGADGRVRDNIAVMEGLPYGVTEEAIKAARRIKFAPAQKDGRPVSQYVTVIYNFNLY